VFLKGATDSFNGHFICRDKGAKTIPANCDMGLYKWRKGWERKYWGRGNLETGITR